jgi:hypothetical protein
MGRPPFFARPSKFDMTLQQEFSHKYSHWPDDRNSLTRGIAGFGGDFSRYLELTCQHPPSELNKPQGCSYVRSRSRAGQIPTTLNADEI